MTDRVRFGIDASIDLEQEVDGRWIAAVVGKRQAGIMAYGKDKSDALRRVKLLLLSHHSDLLSRGVIE